MTIYKIGEVVKVRDDLKMGVMYAMKDSDRYTHDITKSMMELRGKEVMIDAYKYGTYRVKEDPFNFHWTDEMFEGKVS